METRSGIYQIRNLVNGKVYVGSAVCIGRRFKQHVRWLNGRYHSNVKLQRAWDKYGASAFEFVVTELVANPSDLISTEQFWIDVTQAAVSGYNITPTAGSILGTKFSDETKRRMSEARKGRKNSPEHVEAVRKALTGRKMTEEQCEKMRQARLGKKYGNRDPSVGQKISVALTGKKLSDEHRAKLSKAKLGKKQPQAQIDKRKETWMRNYLSGKHKLKPFIN